MLNPAENRKIWMKAAEDSRELLEGRVKNDIEKYRKGYCKLRLTDAEGRPIKNAKIKVNQLSHDFGFGANIFMLEEFDNEEYNQRYRANFKKCFNLATVPFYWDGLSPKRANRAMIKTAVRYGADPPPSFAWNTARKTV